MLFFESSHLGGFERGKYFEIWGVLKLIKISVFQIHFLRTCANIGKLKENRTFVVRCIFWWESACTNRAKNKQDFVDLLQQVKEFKEKWL